MRLRCLATSAVATMTLLSACGGPPKQDSDETAPPTAVTTHAVGPRWGNVEEVGKNANAFIVGTFVGEARTTEDDGGVPEGPKHAVVLRQFQITSARPESVPKTITIALPVSEARPSPTTFGNTETWAFFVEIVKEADRGGLKGEGDLFLPLTNGEAMFRVKDGKASPLKPGMTAELPLAQLNKVPLKS